MSAALEALLAPSAPEAHADVVAWWSAHRARAAGAASTWESAILGGAAADRMGFAFAAGYQAALAALVPSRDRTRTAALAATEAGGAHPRAIATSVTGGELSGQKVFVTLGAQVDELLVLARTGGDQTRAELALLRVQAGSAGVSLTPLAATPFVPEIPHASVRFEAVRAFEVLRGDGWVDYVRPFRTIEDVHVHAALLAWLAATARRHGWDRPLVERAAALLLALRDLAATDPSSAATHVALGGAIELTRALVRELDPLWESAPDDERARWKRDRPLLEVAGKARAQRLARAWERLG